MAKLRTGHRRTAKGSAKVGGRKRPVKVDPEALTESLKGKSPAVAARILRAREIILGELRKARSITGACEEADVSATQFYKWKRDDPEFSEQVEEALEAGRDALEDEAVRRGKNGYRKPVYHQGTVVGYERRYSDRMLELMLRARRPERFRENYKVEVDGTMSHTHTELTKDELVAALAERGLPTEIFEK